MLGRAQNLEIDQGLFHSCPLFTVHPWASSLWLSWERIHLQCRRPGFDPWAGKIPWRRERLPTPVFRPGEFHGLYRPWGCRVRHIWATFTFILFTWTIHLTLLSKAIGTRLQDEEIYLEYVFFSIPIGKVVKSSLNFCRKGNIINQRLDPKQVTSCSLTQWSPKGPQSSLFSTECHAGPLADKILLTSPGDCY